MPQYNLGNVVGLIKSETEPTKKYVLWGHIINPLLPDLVLLKYWDEGSQSWVPVTDITTQYLLKAVLSNSITTPPGSPTVGDRYLIPSGATGDWSTEVDKVAEYKAQGWYYQTPLDGYLLMVRTEPSSIFEYRGTYGSGGTWSEYDFTAGVDVSNLIPKSWINIPTGVAGIENDGYVSPIRLNQLPYTPDVAVDWPENLNRVKTALDYLRNLVKNISLGTAYQVTYGESTVGAALDTLMQEESEGLYILNVTSLGNDTTGNGTFRKPYATLSKAWEIRNGTGYVDKDVVIMLGSGDYSFPTGISSLSAGVRTLITGRHFNSQGNVGITRILGSTTFSGNNLNLYFENIQLAPTITNDGTGTILYLSSCKFEATVLTNNLSIYAENSRIILGSSGSAFGGKVIPVSVSNCVVIIYGGTISNQSCKFYNSSLSFLTFAFTLTGVASELSLYSSTILEITESISLLNSAKISLNSSFIATSLRQKITGTIISNQPSKDISFDPGSTGFPTNVQDALLQLITQGSVSQTYDTESITFIASQLDQSNFAVPDPRTNEIAELISVFIEGLIWPNSYVSVNANKDTFILSVPNGTIKTGDQVNFIYKHGETLDFILILDGDTDTTLQSEILDGDVG